MQELSSVCLGQDPNPVPLPIEGEIQKARERLRDTFKDQYARPQAEFRGAFGRKMLSSVLTETDPAMRTALLLETVDIAAGANDQTTAAAALEEIKKKPGRWEPGARFKVLELQEKADKPGALAEAWSALVSDALESADYDLAVKAADKAESAAARRKDSALLQTARDARDQARLLQREAKGVDESARRLSEAPDDPAANETVGRFLCLLRGEWEKGLPHLARAADAALRQIAETDLATRTDVPGVIKAGDLWWDWAEKQSLKPLKEAARGRAVRWYEQGIGGPLDADRVRAEKRIKAFYDLGGTTGPSGNLALAKSGATISGGTLAEQLIDGVTTGYTGGAGFAWGVAPVEFIVTLPKVYSLRLVRLLLWDGDARFYRYAIETSPDGRTFVPLVDRSQGEWRGWQTHPFPARRVKAIKLKGLFNSSNSQFHAVELEAYCRPPALPPASK